MGVYRVWGRGRWTQETILCQISPMYWPSPIEKHSVQKIHQSTSTFQPKNEATSTGNHQYWHSTSYHHPQHWYWHDQECCLTCGSAAWHLTEATVLVWPASVWMQAFIRMSHTCTHKTKFQQLFLGRKNRLQKSLLVCLLNKNIHILGGGFKRGGVDFQFKTKSTENYKTKLSGFKIYFDFFHLLDEFFF